MAPAGYVALRLARAAATVFGAVTLVFLLVHLIPGDPVNAILGEQAAPEDRALLRRTLRLDLPLAEQYRLFLADLADGSLGQSFRRQSETVSSLIARVLPHTVILALASIAVAWMLAVPLGALSALLRGLLWDRVISALSMLGIAIPHIWLGPLLVLFFGVELRWLPLPGDDPARPAALVLPALTVGAALAAILARQTRGALIEALGEHYITAARARGLPPGRVLFKHALRNALLPVVTVGTAQLGGVLSGSVIAEKIFERPGLGTLFLEAFLDRDIPVVQGCVLVIAIFYVLINLAIDLLYCALDPRVRLA
jgi:peptide/nickel transport system permease protein